jgi:hypothetical protein
MILVKWFLFIFQKIAAYKHIQEKIGNDREFYTQYSPDTFRFIQWRSDSDTVSKCFTFYTGVPKIDMQKNLSIFH